MEAYTVPKEAVIKIHNNLFEIPVNYRPDMQVPARVYANNIILEESFNDRSLWQLVNVATLPGIKNYALAMPDIHEGYGFPIGGVAALSIQESGVISPGGIGYDINCGVRLVALSISLKEIKPYLEKLATALFQAVPSGVGRSGKIALAPKLLDAILRNGAHQALKMGFGVESDLLFCEETGCLEFADATAVSQKAKDRGRDQLGTLGSGNHFLEVQVVDALYDTKAAQVFGLTPDMITIMIHCGSRGLGHQVATDYIRLMLPKLAEWDIKLPDAELACAPFNSFEGQQYFSAMAASANFAWANRHAIGHAVRESCKKIFGDSVNVRTIYDLSHNIGKKEKHIINNISTELIVHRKGATRSFGPGRPEVPELYRSIGQPVLIPGTMGTASYVLVGTEKSMTEAFGSCCHGAGRRLSRMKAKKMVRGMTLREDLEAKGIIIRCDSDAGLAEEAPIAYKDVDNVVNVVDAAGLARKVARLRPIAVIKGG